MRRNPQISATRALPVVSGYDFSGQVQQIGEKVLGFKPGDTVYGMLPLQGRGFHFLAPDRFLLFACCGEVNHRLKSTLRNQTKRILRIVAQVFKLRLQ